MPLQSLAENEVDLKASVVPVLHHATDLELYRPGLPRVADHRVPGGRLVDIVHVVPSGSEHPVVAKAVATPAGPAGDRVLALAADGHYQRAPVEMFEVPIGDCNLGSLTWVVTLADSFPSFTTSGVPLSPAAYRADVYVIDVGRARVPPPEGPDEPLVVVQKGGIVEIGEDALADLDTG